jgi:hypothetical protein
MSADDPHSSTFSLRRWSRRKLEAARAATEPASAPAIVPPPPPAEARATEPVAAAETATPALPPIESLTIDSDFTAFFEPKVDEALKRKALKQLFRDPRFNVMDGLDTYIDDYSQPDPIAPEIVREMVQGRYIFDPPKTRVNEQGAVEDVPPDVAAVESTATKPEALPAAAPAAFTGASVPTDVAARDAGVPAAAHDASPAGAPEKPGPATR